MSEKGRPLPKFGEWDVNDPASAEGFTVIFNKARDEKKTGGKPESPSKGDQNNNVRHGGVVPSRPPSIGKLRLTGVELVLRKELESNSSEVDFLRQKSTHLESHNFPLPANELKEAVEVVTKRGKLGYLGEPSDAMLFPLDTSSTPLKFHACRQDCRPMKLWQSLPIIPPG